MERFTFLSSLITFLYFFFDPLFFSLNFRQQTRSKRGHYGEAVVAMVTPPHTLFLFTGVQKGAGRGDEGEDGHRLQDEAIPALDEERGAGPAHVCRRLTDHGPRSPPPHPPPLCTDNAGSAVWR